MMGRGNNFLGIAFTTEQSVACAEVSVAGGVRAVRRAATFVFPDGATLDSPAAAGQALAGFLRQQKFTSSRVVVGVPAKWLVALEKELPPADEAQAHAALRLQAERLAVAESGEMIFDFAGESHRSIASKVLLVGMQRQRLDRITRLMDAAGMSLVAVTSSSLSMSAAVMSGGDGGVLTINRTGGELVWRQGGSPRMLRHVPLALNGQQAPSTQALAGEFRRMIALAGSNGTTAGRSLLLLDSLGLSDEQVATLATRLGVAVESKTQREMLGVDAAGASATPDVSPAIALALLAASNALPLNFAHSRLAAPVALRIGKLARYAIVVGAIALAALIWLIVSVTQRQSELDGINARLKAIEADVKSSKGTIDRLSYGRGFFPQNRPPVLESLRDVTNAFRPDEKVWATSFIMRDNGKGTLSGKSSDQKTVLRVLDGIKQSSKFSEVKLLDMREADARSGDVAFSIGFTYSGVE